MEIGAFTFADVSPYPDGVHAAQRLPELIEEIVLADSASVLQLLVRDWYSSFPNVDPVVGNCAERPIHALELTWRVKDLRGRGKIDVESCESARIDPPDKRGTCQSVVGWNPTGSAITNKPGPLGPGLFVESSHPPAFVTQVDKS